MRNNNSKIIRKITARSLRANTRRNFFITIAIALTAFMITSVFSIGISFYESIRMSGFRFEGIYSHASITGLSQEQLIALEGLSYVRRVSHSGFVGWAQVPGFEPGINMFYTCPETWRYFQTPVFTNITGREAQAENEIALSINKLTAMGIYQPYIGMEIPLQFALRDLNDSRSWAAMSPMPPTYSKTFILSGFYTEFVSVLSGGTPVFVSQAFAGAHGFIIPEDTNVNIQFTSFARSYEFTRRLVDDLGLEDGQYYAAHPALERGMDINPTITYMVMGVFIAFFMFTGFLLVYNVMYVSVSKDVRFYGMLKTLGTTPRQLRRVVNGQVLWLLIIGLPVGLIASTLVSFALVPAFIGDIATGVVVSFSPMIYVGGVVFTLLTAYLGAFTSARKAARVSPIESIKYAGEFAANVKAVSKPARTAQGRPHRMAWRNAFRERKRAIIVLISLFLGLTVFTTTVTIVTSADVDNEISYWYDFDFVISSSFDTPINEDFATQVASIDGVTDVHKMTFAIGQVESKGLYGTVYGIDTAWLLEIEPDIGNYIDIAAFERGEIVLRSERWIRFHENVPNSGFAYRDASREDLPVGAALELSLSAGEEQFTTDVVIAGYIRRVLNFVGFTIGGIIPDGRRMELLMSNNFLNQLDAPVHNLGLEVRPGADSYVNSALYSLLPQNMRMRSTYEARRAYEEGMFTLLVMGVGLSAIMGLIGIFNFINVIAVGLYVRKRELAALESVGMTRRQMRAMLRWEGVIYWAAIIFASLATGPGIAYGLFAVINSQAPMQFPQFAYPFLPIGLVYGVIVFLCTITPEVAYKGVSRLSLVERLREVE